jgi:hypothetical protein
MIFSRPNSFPSRQFKESIKENVGGGSCAARQERIHTEATICANSRYTPLLVFVNSRAGLTGHLLVTLINRLFNPTQGPGFGGWTGRHVESHCISYEVTDLEVCGGDRYETGSVAPSMNPKHQVAHFCLASGNQ